MVLTEFMTLLFDQSQGLSDLQSLNILYTGREQPLLTFCVTVLTQAVHNVQLKLADGYSINLPYLPELFTQSIANSQIPVILVAGPKTSMCKPVSAPNVLMRSSPAS